MSITAIVENDTIKLPVHVPDGTSVDVRLPGVLEASSPTTPSPLQAFRRLQAELGLTEQAASRWKNRIADARR